MSDDAPTISVVIPARDAASTIGAQLAALARQSLDETWEVLVCDNGSSDHTAEIVHGWADRLPVRVIDAREATSAGDARNFGVTQARGHGIAFCDADDVVADDWLSSVTEGLKTHTFIGCLSETSSLNPGRLPGETSGPLYRWASPPGLPFASSRAMAVRRAAFVSVGGFDASIRIGEDTDLSWRLQLAGTPLVPWPSAVVHVRQRQHLRAAVRQGYLYGFAERELTKRFADASPPGLAAALDPPVDEPAVPPAPAPVWTRGGRIAGRLRRLLGVRGTSDFQPFLQRRARWFGRNLPLHLLFTGRQADRRTMPGSTDG